MMSLPRTPSSAKVCAGCGLSLSVVCGACSLTTSFDGLTGPPASCKAIHSTQPALPSGPYTIYPGGSGPSAATSVYCDMTYDDGNGAGGWTLIESIQSGKSPESTTFATVMPGTTTAMPLATVEALAAVSTQVHIRTPGMASTQSITSIAHSPPIVHLRAGQILNSVKDPQYQNWTGPYATPGYLDFTCTGMPPSLNYWPNVYWACGNNTGLTLEGSSSEWEWSDDTDEPFEVYVR